jgi:CRISPR-associated protein Csb2
MPSFSLVIEYLTGYAVATDPANRERAEWPPHPARVFMALAAAHFETDPTNQAQRRALEWLAALPPPDVTVPQHTQRDVRTVYVPVNDQRGGDALLQRSRQPRLFPRVHIGSEPLRQSWQTRDDPPANHLEALESICRNVTRIGHSSSLVWARIEGETSVPSTHVPEEHAPEKRMRVVQAGELQRLEEAFNRSAIDQFFSLKEQISTSKGGAKKQLQNELNERFPRGQPATQRPTISISHGYRAVALPTDDVVQSAWDADFIVLRESEGARQSFGLESTALVTDSLRKLIMLLSTVQPVPSWVGGHEPNGDKLTTQNHMALIPLAYVGRPWVKNEQHADGHLMGVGVVLPRDLPYRDRAKVLSQILFDSATYGPKTLDLTMGSAGVWMVERETDLSPKQSLRTTTYSGPSFSWASVTPVLLDRMPKSDRVNDPAGWREEVAGLLAQSCQRIGMPDPVSIRVEKTPFFRGSLRAMPGQGGFPQLRKGRFQVHARIEFDQPVNGPLLLGAGRFRGYGLMRPWISGAEQ